MDKIFGLFSPGDYSNTILFFDDLDEQIFKIKVYTTVRWKPPRHSCCCGHKLWYQQSHKKLKFIVEKISRSKIFYLSLQPWHEIFQQLRHGKFSDMLGTSNFFRTNARHLSPAAAFLRRCWCSNSTTNKSFHPSSANEAQYKAYARVETSQFTFEFCWRKTPFLPTPLSFLTLIFQSTPQRTVQSYKRKKCVCLLHRLKRGRKFERQTL